MTAVEVLADETVAHPHEKARDSDSVSTFSAIIKESGAETNTPGSEEDALFAHLPSHEKEILKKQLDAPVAKISFFGLYRYASRMDVLIMLVSAICAIAAGAALPLFTVSISSYDLMELSLISLDRFCLDPWPRTSKGLPWELFPTTTSTTN